MCNRKYTTYTNDMKIVHVYERVIIPNKLNDATIPGWYQRAENDEFTKGQAVAIAELIVSIVHKKKRRREGIVWGRKKKKGDCGSCVRGGYHVTDQEGVKMRTSMELQALLVSVT